MPKLGVADRDAQQSLASDGLRPPMKQTIVGVAPAEREVISAGPASCHTPSVRRCQNGIVPGPFRARGAELLQQLPELVLDAGEFHQRRLAAQQAPVGLSSRQPSGNTLAMSQARRIGVGCAHDILLCIGETMRRISPKNALAA